MRKKVLRSAVLMILAVTFCLATTGCPTIMGGSNWTPLQKAEVGAYMAQSTYKDIYAQCVAYKPLTEKDKKIYNDEIRPKVNDLKKYLIVYIDAVDAWKQGKTNGADIDGFRLKVDTLIADVFAYGIIKLK